MEKKKYRTAEALAGSLISAFAGGTDYSGVPLNELPDNMQIVQNALGGSNFTAAYQNMTSQGYESMQPSAYLNYLVFDENFRLVTEQSAAIQVSGLPNQWNDVGSANQIEIGRTGYLMIFTSSSASSKMYFDRVDVTFYKGTVLEEDHYYPFGLTLNITPAITLDEKNNVKFQGQRLEDDLGLNWYSYKYRMHDMQIGRFTSIDPLAQSYPYNSTYAFSENKVTNGVELEGLEYLPVNSSIYRMTFSKSGNSVSTIASNIPAAISNGKGGFSYNMGLPVGTNGRDFNGTYMRSANLKSVPNFYGTNSETVDPPQTASTKGNLTPTNGKSQDASHTSGGAAAITEAVKLGENWQNQDVWNASGDESKSRTGFYNATNAVDQASNLPAIYQNGDGRANLINLLTDGSLPSYNLSGMSNEEIHSVTGDLLNLFKIGYNLAADNGIPIRSETVQEYKDILSKYINSSQ